MTRYRANRKSLLAAVHIARKDLGLDEDGYRDVLETVTGKRSAADLKVNELVKICGHFEKLGWQGHGTPRQRGNVANGTDGANGQGRDATRPYVRGREGTDRLMGKLRAMCEVMGRPWPRYVEAILAKQGIERLEWAYPEDLRRVVASMEYQKKREATR